MHLGVPNYEESLKREKLFVKWLCEIEKDAKAIYLLGDIFDFWFEYKKVVPRYFTRLLGKIAEITDKGTPVHFFTGNHDLWVSDYLQKETGVILHRGILKTELSGKKFYIAHGDGLGPDDKGYKFLKKIFTNKFLQKVFSLLHPNFAVRIASFWSIKSRYSKKKNMCELQDEDKEFLILHSKKIIETEYFEYFVFGHRHLPIKIKLNEKSTYINTGDWLNHFTYAVFDGTEMKLSKI